MRSTLRASTSRPGAPVVAALTWLLLVLVWPGVAHAHPALVETTPGAGYAVTAPPEAVGVAFNERVTPVEPALMLHTADGEQIPLTVSVERGRTALRGVPQAELEPGSYEVSYKVVALDGDLIEGTFPFGVATPVEATSTAGGVSQDDPDQVQPATAAARAVLFGGLSLALGGLVGAAIARRETGGRATLRPLLRTGSAAGAGAALFLLGQVASFHPTRLGDLLASSRPARLLAAEAALFALALALGSRRLRGWGAAAALSGVVLLEGVRAHPGEAAGSAGALLTVAHLAAAAVWVGALVHVVRLAIAWRGRSLGTWLVVGGYARVALVLFLLVAATGTLSALLLLPSLEDWTGTTYGTVLLAKLALFVAASVAAALARARHRRGVEHGRDVLDRASQRPWVLAAPARMEAGLLVGVLVVTAALTSATPPRLVSQTALLPAPTGAVVRAADRAEQVSVAAVASAGRLELRAYAPGPEESNTYAIDVELQRPDGRAQDLDLDSCGAGCWTAQVQWGEGMHAVSADVASEGWQGGQARILVPWPPQPANAVLQRVQEQMGAQSQLRTTESVTSGFGFAPTTTSVRTGQEYLDGQPWSDGGTTDPVTYTRDGTRVLLFAMPVLGYHFQLTLDENDRVIAERVVTRNHLLLRRYTYPQPG
jgi:copper transport protein